jgi:hydroxyacylglutathione hydrolase
MEIKIFTFNLFYENTYVLYDETGQCVIIDPGCSVHTEEAELKNFITDKNLMPVRQLNTHCHIDHVLGNQFVVDTYGLGLEANINESNNLNRAVDYAAVFGLNRPVIPPLSKTLDEGQVIKFGNTSLDILFTPGHSPGHVVFYNKKDRVIIGGDVLFRESIGRTDLPGGNYSELIRSIQEKLFSLDDDITVYPGHGPTTTIGYEKQYNPYLQEVVS